jgi:hypothetical protein
MLKPKLKRIPRRYNRDGFVYALPMLFMPGIVFASFRGITERIKGLDVMVRRILENDDYDDYFYYVLLLGAFIFFLSCWRALSLWRRPGYARRLPISIRIALGIMRPPFPFKPLAALWWLSHWLGLITVALVIENLWMQALPGGEFHFFSGDLNIGGLLIAYAMAYLISLASFAYFLAAVAVFLRRRRLMLGIWHCRHVLSSSLALVALGIEASFKWKH